MQETLHRELIDINDTESEEKYTKLVRALAKNPRVIQSLGRKGFGRNGVFFNGKLFAFLSYRKQLVLRLEPELVKDLVATGDGMYWDPRRDGRVFKHWVVLKPSSKRDWLVLARQALELAKAPNSPKKIEIR